MQLHCQCTSVEFAAIVGLFFCEKLEGFTKAVEVPNNSMQYTLKLCDFLSAQRFWPLKRAAIAAAERSDFICKERDSIHARFKFQMLFELERARVLRVYGQDSEGGPSSGWGTGKITKLPQAKDRRR